MNKIIVIGCPGSGKSTLSTKLGKKLNIPVHHLDDWQHLPKDEFRKVQNELMEGEKWILDGNFTKSIDSRLGKADTALFLDFPKRTVYLRALKRYFGDPRTIIKNFSNTWGVLKYIGNFPRNEILSILEQYKESRKIVVLHSQKEVNIFLTNL